MSQISTQLPAQLTMHIYGSVRVGVNGPSSAIGTVFESTEWATAKAFLLAHPHGVYTCARAVRNGEDAAFQVVDEAFHQDRLSQGFRIAHVQNADACCKLMEVTSDCIGRALQAVSAGNDQVTGDLMVTVLWAVCDVPDIIHVSVYVCAMPQVKSSTANVFINGEPRSQPSCKHSKWIVDRVPLEERQREIADVCDVELHESILSRRLGAGDRALLEGLITSLFVVKGGCVYTSGEGVLDGSTRALVFQACERLKIPVVYEAPRLSEISTWQAAFLTSAVRIVVPIARVVWISESEPNRICQHDLAMASQTLTTLHRIRASILDHLTSVT